jgi:hypothetical protein
MRANTCERIPQINQENFMKTVCKIATFTLIMFAVSEYGFSQMTVHHRPAATTTQNLVRGVFGPVGSDNNWANYSVFNLIPGSALFPITSSTTVFYFGFTAGTEADISNMVVYTTPRGSLTISAATPVKLGGVTSPTIHLSNTSVCPTQPLSSTNPCIVRFDPTTLTLSPESDYYLTVFFTNDSNNSALGATQPGNLQSSLSSIFLSGTDYTKMKAGQTLPSATDRAPNFLMYVMNN